MFLFSIFVRAFSTRFFCPDVSTPWPGRASPWWGRGKVSFASLAALISLLSEVRHDEPSTDASHAPSEARASIVSFSHTSTDVKNEQVEAALTDSVQFLIALLSNETLEADLHQAGCSAGDASGIVKQMRHLMRLSFCLAAARHGLTAAEAGLVKLVADRLNDKRYPRHDDGASVYPKVRALRSLVKGINLTVRKTPLCLSVQFSIGARLSRPAHDVPRDD